ncbi:MAG TPA: hypothetical protein VF545_02700 [Thermoleophilaceae bacterium]|jgi:hypothetical protein
MNFATSATGTPTTKPNSATGLYLTEDSSDPANSANNEQPRQDDKVTFGLPSGTALNKNAAAKCGASDQDFSQKGESACSKKSNVGSGNAKIRLRIPDSNDIPASVTLFNGKGKTLITYVNPQGAQPIVLRSTVNGKLGKNQTIVVPIPISCVLGSPPNCDPNAGDARISHLDLTIKRVVRKKKKNGKTIKIPLIKTPKKCPASKTWTFTVAFHARDNSVTDNKTSDSPCKTK